MLCLPILMSFAQAWFVQFPHRASHTGSEPVHRTCAEVAAERRARPVHLRFFAPDFFMPLDR